MTDQPRYVDDPFEEQDWKYPKSQFEVTLLAAVGRKSYDTQANSKRVKSIERLAQGDMPRFAQAYIDKQLEWARKKNRERKGSIVLRALISAIKNPDNLARHYKETHEQHDDSNYDASQGW